MLTLETLRRLNTPAGAAVLAELSAQDLADERTLTVITALRRTLPADVAGAALELARLRQRAVGKFGADGGRMWFTRDGLEQASDREARAYHAVGCAGLRVADLCCGIGSDALAFARGGAIVTAVDMNPLHAEMTRLNAEALGLPLSVCTADVRELNPDAELIFFDPARRDAQGRRLHTVEHYQPPLSALRRWQTPRLMAKLSPGVQLSELSGYGGTIEFLSVNGDLKEALLRTMPEAFGTNPAAQATLILGGQALHWPDDDRSPGPISEPRAWLIEPDPALIRAGLVTSAGRAWNAAQLDETIAYLTADTPPETPWARAWRVLEWMPFNVKALRAALRARAVGHAAVKRRGSPVSPEALLPQLKLKGLNGATIVLTRHVGKPIALICAEHPETTGLSRRSDELNATDNE